jgi:hypothetical protein
MIAFVAGGQAYVVYAQRDKDAKKSILLNKKEILVMDTSTPNTRFAISDICFASNGDYIVAVGRDQNGIFIFPQWDAMTLLLSSSGQLTLQHSTISHTNRRKLIIKEKECALLLNRPDHISNIVFFTFRHMFRFSEKDCHIKKQIHTNSFASHGLLSKFSGSNEYNLNGSYTQIFSPLQRKALFGIHDYTQLNSEQYMFSAFASNEEAMYIRSGANHVEKRMLYGDEWISFFKKFQEQQFSLQELHALHHNFNFSSSDDRQNIDRFLNSLIKEGLDRGGILYTLVHKLIVQREEQKEQQKKLAEQQQHAATEAVLSEHKLHHPPTQPKSWIQSALSKIIYFEDWRASKLPYTSPQIQPAPQPPQVQYQLPLALAEAEDQQPEGNEPVNEATAQEQHAPAVGPVGRIFNGIMSVIRRTMGWLWRSTIGRAFS